MIGTRLWRRRRAKKALLDLAQLNLSILAEAELGAGETSSISQGLGNGAGIDIFKLTSDRNTPGKTAYFQPLSLKHHAEIMRGRFTFGREVGSQNDLAHQTIVNATQQALDMQVIWTDAIKR